MRASASGDSLSSSAPVVTRPSTLIPSSQAMTLAVRGWSPVIMIGRMPGVFRAHDRVFRLDTRQIDDADQAGEHEVLFDACVRMSRMLRQSLARQPSSGDAERPQRLARKLLVRLEYGCAPLGGERSPLLPDQFPGAPRQQDVNSRPSQWSRGSAHSA
jgi:hypothetical protein